MQNKLPSTEPTRNHKAGRFLCTICEKRFRKPCLLRRHEVVHSSEKFFKCSECQKLFTQNSSLQRHYIEQHGSNKKRHQCSKCPLSFSQKTNLQLHDKRVHLPLTVGKPTNMGYACDRCPSVYCNKQKLSRHINAAHKVTNDKIHFDDEVDDDLAFTQNVLEQLKSFQIEMEAFEVPTLTSLDNVEISKTTSASNTDVADEPQQECIGKLSDEVDLKDQLRPPATISCLRVQRANALYACEFCSKQFQKSYDFLRHRRVHTHERPYICLLCERAFITKTKLNEHVKVHRLDEHLGLLYKHYPCAVCCRTFSSLRQLDKHVKIHANTFTLKYKCKSCDATFKTSIALSSHKHAKIDEPLNYLKRLLPTPIDVSTTNKSDTNSISEENNFDEVTVVPLNVEQHLRIEPKWKCATCSRLFSSSSMLNKHRRIYHGVYSRKSNISTSLTLRCFKCVYCAKYFKSQSVCNDHMLNHLKHLMDTDATKQEKQTTFMSNIVNGLVIVTETSTNVIAIVKPFNAIITYRKRAENVEKTQCVQRKNGADHQHQCHFCQRQFKKSCDIKRHLLVHTGERLHHCPSCGKHFSLSSTLKKHQLTHSLKRSKCVCIVCGKMYSDKKTLKVHLRLHTGEQPFHCEHCEMKFRTSGQKITHMRVVHEV